MTNFQNGQDVKTDRRRLLSYYRQKTSCKDFKMPKISNWQVLKLQDSLQIKVKNYFRCFRQRQVLKLSVSSKTPDKLFQDSWQTKPNYFRQEDPDKFQILDFLQILLSKVTKTTIRMPWSNYCSSYCFLFKFYINYPSSL